MLLIQVYEKLSTVYIYIYIYIYTLFLVSFPIYVIMDFWVKFSVWYSRLSLSILYTVLCICQSQPLNLTLLWSFATVIISFFFVPVQFSSVSCVPLFVTPMDSSTPGLPVHHQLPELPQTHVHWVGDATQQSHPLSSPSPPSFNLFQHQGLFQWVSSLHQVAKVLEFQLQHQSFQWTLRAGFL